MLYQRHSVGYVVRIDALYHPCHVLVIDEARQPLSRLSGSAIRRDVEVEIRDLGELSDQFLRQAAAVRV